MGIEKPLNEEAIGMHNFIQYKEEQSGTVSTGCYANSKLQSGFKNIMKEEFRYWIVLANTAKNKLMLIKQFYFCVLPQI